MKYILLLGRILYSLIFILSGASHFLPSTIEFAEKSGVPMTEIMVPLSGAIAILGGISILIGYRAKVGAWLLVIFLVPITALMHQFWNVSNSEIAMLQFTMFMKNLSMLGAALIIAYFGSGPLSVTKGKGLRRA